MPDAGKCTGSPDCQLPRVLDMAGECKEAGSMANLKIQEFCAKLLTSGHF
jgi:hypothetical protein